MKTQSILSAIQNHKGQVLNYHIQSQIPTLKSVQNVVVTKDTRGYCLSGIAFENRKEVKEGIANGERGEVQPLPWGNWKQFPFVIEHKGNDYVRLYLPTPEQETAFHLHGETMFFANGEQISREKAIELCGSKIRSSNERPDCMTCKVDNIISIGD